MKKYITIFIILIYTFSLNSITVNQLQQLQNNGELIVGKGTAKTELCFTRNAHRNILQLGSRTLRS